MTKLRSYPAPVVALALGLVITASLTGCVSAGSAPSTAVGSAPRGEIRATPFGGADALTPDKSGGGDSGSPASSGTADQSDARRDIAGRAVVSTGTVRLTVEKPTDAAASAVRIVETAGGRVDDRSQRAATEHDHGSASLTLRIPSGVLTKTLAEIGRLGDVDDMSVSARDVTADRTDLDARITALRASVDRLVDLMSRSATTADLITIESALSQRQSDLESLEGQRQALGSQIELATIALELGSVAPSVAPAPTDFLSGLAIGWGALLSVIAGAIVLIGVLVPWVVPAALIAAIALVLLRRRRRSRAA